MEILQEFERFKSPGGSFKPKISIRKRGQIGLNSGIINRMKLGDFNYAVMFISKDRKRIAFKFTNNQDEEGAIQIIKRKGNYYFSGISFLEFYGIDYSEGRPFDAQCDIENMVAIIDLEKPSES